jgi:hypothetical protein
MSGWNFRKTKSLLGGLVRLTATKRGVSASVGRGPVRVSRGADGRYRATVRVGPLYRTIPLGRARTRSGRVDLQPRDYVGLVTPGAGPPAMTGVRDVDRQDRELIEIYGWPAPEGAPLPGPGAWGPPQGPATVGPFPPYPDGARVVCPVCTLTFPDERTMRRHASFRHLGADGPREGA